MYQRIVRGVGIGLVGLYSLAGCAISEDYGFNKTTMSIEGKPYTVSISKTSSDEGIKGMIFCNNKGFLRFLKGFDINKKQRKKLLEDILRNEKRGIKVTRNYIPGLDITISVETKVINE